MPYTDSPPPGLHAYPESIGRAPASADDADHDHGPHQLYRLRVGLRDANGALRSHAYRLTAAEADAWAAEVARIVGSDGGVWLLDADNDRIVMAAETITFGAVTANEAPEPDPDPGAVMTNAVNNFLGNMGRG